MRLRFSLLSNDYLIVQERKQLLIEFVEFKILFHGIIWPFKVNSNASTQPIAFTRYKPGENNACVGHDHFNVLRRFKRISLRNTYACDEIILLVCTEENI